jgi:protein-L-isoaspartate(D-aspartate) O-methyltransferase
VKQLLAFLSLLFLSSRPIPDDEYKGRRELMVRTQIEDRGVIDSATLRAMGTVQRHLFVPPEARNSAYADHPLPIGYGQTISQPYIVAYMTELVRPKRGMRVLEIGTGSGYQAAILAEIVDSVFTIEIITELANSAATRLSSLGYKNIVVKNADGYYGWKKHAPFDAILVTAAAEYLPPPLLEQLKEGGRMVVPVGMPFLVQTLILVEKTNGQIETESLMPVRFVPLTRGK